MLKRAIANKIKHLHGQKKTVASLTTSNRLHSLPSTGINYFLKYLLYRPRKPAP